MSIRSKLILSAVISLAVFAGIVTAGRADQKDRDPARPLVIGHRGSAGYLPDHTLQGYALAIERGADFVEPDLVSTKDGRLIARHEPNMIATTDVASRPEFASRRKFVSIDGAAPEEGFFASDFTLAEIKTLRAIQPIPSDRLTVFDGKFQIPTLEEVIDLVKRKSKEKGRTIGIYPETKHPTYHRSIGLPLEERLAKILKNAGWDRRDSPVFLQSFEPSSLQRLRQLTRNRLIQLIDANDVHPDGTLDFTAPFDRPYDWTVSGNPVSQARTFAFLVTNAGLDEVRTYADGIGPWKRYIVSTAAIKLDANGGVADANGDGKIDESDLKLLPPTDVIERAHAKGLLVHTWTFRNEPRRLAADYRNIPVAEYLQFYQIGVDGVFSDFADTAVTARVLFRLLSDPGFGPCFIEAPGAHGCD